MADRVLVTGAGGFLGSHICAYLGRRGRQVFAIDRATPVHPSPEPWSNLLHFYQMELPSKAFGAILDEFQPDVLVHCAGAASVPYSMEEPYEDFRLSAGLSAFVLEMLRRHVPSCRFIFLSSAAVYGNPETLPVREDSPCSPISPYGYHKHICEMLCREYASLFGIRASVLRIFSAYGERLCKQVVFDLCRKFSDPTLSAVEVYGTGNETRDFVHGSDIARAIECINAAGAEGIFNVASGRQTRIAEIADMVREHMASEKEIIFVGVTRPGDPSFWQADISKLFSLGFSPETDLNDGIRRYCGWFQREYRKDK